MMLREGYPVREFFRAMSGKSFKYNVFALENEKRSPLRERAATVARPEHIRKYAHSGDHPAVERLWRCAPRRAIAPTAPVFASEGTVSVSYRGGGDILDGYCLFPVSDLLAKGVASHEPFSKNAIITVCWGKVGFVHARQPVAFGSFRRIVSRYGACPALRRGTAFVR